MKNLLLIPTVFVATALTAQAQSAIASWSFEPDPFAANLTNTTFPSSGAYAADVGTGALTAVHASASTVWSSPAGNGSANSLSANNWSLGDYFQFQFSTLTFSNISITWSQARSSTGVTNFSLAYSLDGSSFTTYTNYTVLQSGGAGAPGTWISTSNNPIYVLSYDLSSVTAINNQDDVYLRLVADQAPGASTGTVRIDDVTIVPEPSTYALLALGAMGLGAHIIRRRRR